MYLKRLELLGFKSFPEKIRLEFNQGITAVVGPNGSGKSNIADAVRWVLGEQSAKSLRGAKMEDIIFAGTQSRRPLGFAEVTIVIDNGDERLGVEFSEVSVTRRVFRSGESEYSINGAACRLRDIHEMFMDTGIGKEGYSIIGQGRVEEILSTRSEDRRLLFEEAAGIVKFRNRKNEAANKIERERQNLLRVGDIISELEAQLEPLELKSEAAKKYLELRDRLKLLQVNIFLLDADRAESELRELEEALETAKEQRKSAEAARERLRAEKSAAQDEAEQADEKIRELTGKLNDLRFQADAKENDAKISAEQISFLEQASERLQADIKNETEKLNGLSRNAEDESERLGGVDARLATAHSALKAKEDAFSEISRRMFEGEQRIEKYNTDLIEQIKVSTDKKAGLQKIEDEYERMGAAKEALNDEREAAASQLGEKNTRLLTLLKTQEENNAAAAKAEADRKKLFGEKDAKSLSLAQETDRLLSVQKMLNEGTSRLKLLTELEQGYEGYYKSVKSVLMEKKRRPDAFAGICGAVAELMEVDERFETAIEVAMGGSAQNIVTETEETATAAIEFLKDAKAGRATFLPLSAIKPRDVTAGERGKLLREAGVCGVASELVRFDARYRNIFSSLLGRVIIVDCLDNAVKLAKKHEHSYKIVTLDGDLLNVGGAMTGGSSGQRVMNLFSRSREIKELNSRITELHDENGRLRKLTEATKAQLDIIDGQIEERRGVLQQIAIERVSIANGIEQARESIAALERERLRLENEDERLMAGLIDKNREIRETEKELAGHNRQVEQIQNELNEFQSRILAERAEKEDGMVELMTLKTEISGLAQKREAALENLQRIDRELEQVKELIEKYLREVDEKAQLKAKCTAGIAELKTQAEALRAQQAETGLAIAGAEELKRGLKEKLSKLEQNEQDNRDLLESISGECVRLEMRKEQRAEARRRLFDEMWDEYEITYQSAKEYLRLELGLSQMQRDSRAVKSEMAALGDVNIGAIEEFKQVKQRYGFLTAQRDDIIATEQKLQGIIAELVAQMEKQFSEQFKLISDNFAIVFAEMFGGGKAYLQLSDEKNVLESGIDIIAQPPGKNLQSMSLLSGGERALTATALLFGILRMKPSPFCILDEVESALDDANVIRYANYLKNFSGETQFILVTHRKGTMEAADALYGVTMQEQGVSKLVSVKFAE